ncbi:WD repeat-containing protein 44 [Diplogelasinospora grovesii]|uniref:WD repeat-containing protein 44 n=1 Tax=Diplogelasinospora grovesii TaxID=303347 RepID=A0AAN6NEJ1_9PEZI|nr:WD repeat-containing protein 44 [Diplogelasinospora grovesii]
MADGFVFPSSNRKSPSFLSRLSMRGGKRKDAGDLDSDSEFGYEARLDGTNARVFSQAVTGSVAGGGYIPRHKEPPRYIRTKAHNKKTRDFSRMFLAQELVGTKPAQQDSAGVGAGDDRTPALTVSVAGPSGRKLTRTGGAIWAAEFSKDGKYLAAAGRDRVVRVWAVISTPEERRAHEEDEAANGAPGERLSAPVFRDHPVQEFEGHTGEVLDLSWSKNNFLLSSSMDKTVRLWHISRKECLCTFKHKDFVTKLAFHPRDDRFFLAGSLDTMLRLWSIPDKAVAFSAQLPDLVTAVAFSPDGKTAIAGVLNGLCLFYETEGLKYHTQIHVRSSRGKNAKGSKITGIQTMRVPPQSVARMPSGQAAPSSSTSRTSTDLASAAGDVKVLITSNDSRIRVYNLRDKSLDVKLKGHDNACSQIAASFSDDGKYVICGSEDRKAFIWSLGGNDTANQDKDKSPCEYFEAHGDMVTTALFAPTQTRMLLGQSGDPIYDLCNPPPVTLRSLEEAASAAASQIALSSEEPQTPAPVEATTRRPEESPAYIARSTHFDGNIIVTSDDSGIIKVFRQDCAFLKRKHESWETGSTFSRKLNAHGGGFIGGGLARTGSILTRTSASSVAHSRRGSLSQPIAPGTLGSPHLGANAVNSDRILSWRQDIENGSDRRTGAVLGGTKTPSRSERSLSPTKTSRTPLSPSAVNLASEARKQPYASSPVVNRPNSAVTSPTASVSGSFSPDRLPLRLSKDKDRKEEDLAAPPTPSFTFRSAEDEDQLRLDPAGASYSFWNLNRWRGITGFRGQAQANGHTRTTSDGSALSKSRNQDCPSDEKEEDSRRKSLSASAAAATKGPDDEKAGRRKSLLPSSLSRKTSDSDISSVPAIQAPGGEGDQQHLSPAVRAGSPYRRLWSRGNSVASRLSSELGSEVVDEGDGEEMKCGKCGGMEFKARRVAGKQRLSCGRCGMLVDE